jgi:hypothetical protein
MLSRIELAEALTASGFKIKASTLGAMACRRVGPPFEIWGNRARYRWADALKWACSRAKRRAARRES